MIYIAGHPVLVLCDSKKSYDMTVKEADMVKHDIVETLKDFIRHTTKFDPFSIDIMYSNMENRLCGDQFVLTLKITYLTETFSFNSIPYIEELDSKHYLNTLKHIKSYAILDRCLDLDTFELFAEEYKNIEFCSEMNNLI